MRAEDWSKQVTVVSAPPDLWFRLLVADMCPKLVNVVLEEAQRQDWQREMDSMTLAELAAR